MTLNFVNGHSYVMPDMIIHYIKTHNFKPPESLVNDVLSGELDSGARGQTKAPAVINVGYLSGNTFEVGETPKLFMFALAGMMGFAATNGDRRQTRST